jgi:hypothetical protein
MPVCSAMRPPSCAALGGVVSRAMQVLRHAKRRAPDQLISATAGKHLVQVNRT